MPSTTPTSRRRLLQLLAGAPVLPLGIRSMAALSLAACGGGGGQNLPGNVAAAPTPSASFVSAEFIGMPAPGADQPTALATTTVSSRLKANFSDGSSQTWDLAYQTFFLTGDKVPDGKGGTIVAGGYYDIRNQPIVDASVAGRERQFFSDAPDGSSLLTVPGAKVDGVKGNAVFAVVQFEYNTANQAGASTYGVLPSPIAVLTLDQDPASGRLTLVKYHNVDTSGVHGLWSTCGASLSPWGTHLSSEEYEPDAFDQGLGGQSLAMLRAFSQNTFGNPATANPYHYGHLPEVSVNPDGTGSIRKHYCLGRYSHELVQVMPDQRTVLGGDDSTNGGLFLLVADKAGDLSAGTLYAAKYTTPLTETTTGTIEWIRLGHASSGEVQAMVDGGIVATDIMDSVLADPADASYTHVTLNTKPAWVRVKPGQEKAAAFLETHRYAALKGASMAFTKNEGTTLNVKDKVAYSAYSTIQDSMVEGGSGYVAGHNVKFRTSPAGLVMVHKLSTGQVDDTGTAIGSDWVPIETSVLLAGEDLAAPDALGNTANPDKVAGPDNLKFSEKLRTLFIGEDSDNHLNNFLWAYDVDSRKLQRVLSCPAGAESTGLHAVDEINGWTYVMSNFQHAGDELGRYPTLGEALKNQIEGIIDASYNDKSSSAVGYLTADLRAPGSS
ncbi:PhoX family protein [Ramlibacter sp. MMS24-I3-19]|uniref:PhoX family protein n=1 Tax=Ramlibacter sp. MMS24-I3-19 TaxID=3416606 RepID=UPI003D021963